MTKSRKVELLYNKARGQGMNATPQELKELARYMVGNGEGNYATKRNISAYVTAVDQGSHRSFYDWCIDNGRGDRRRKGGSAKEIREDEKTMSFAAIFMGWLAWGIAIYWILHGSVPAGECAVAGAVVSLVIYKLKREWAGITLFILPIVLAVIFGR
ncbi:MAG: hypothetical protein IJ600_10675 [Lachnospiraceae bacterium]|nr:hypothetical protein [Lachnospiraceae bacterium]